MSNVLQKAILKALHEKGKMPKMKMGVHKSKEGGLTQKGVEAYRRANPGSKLKTAVTTEPSKLKKGSKSANRRKSFCARMGGMKKRLTSKKTASDPNSRINKSLRKWNCSTDIIRGSRLALAERIKYKNAKFERCVKKIKNKIKEDTSQSFSWGAGARPVFPKRSNWRRAFKWAGAIPGVKQAVYSKPAQSVLGKIGLQKGFLEDPSSKWGAFLRGAELIPRWMPPGSPKPKSRGSVMGQMLSKYAGNPERQQDLIRRFKKVGVMDKAGKLIPSRKGYARGNKPQPKPQPEPQPRMTRPEGAPTPLMRKDYLKSRAKELIRARRPEGAPTPLGREDYLKSRAKELIRMTRPEGAPTPLMRKDYLRSLGKELTRLRGEDYLRSRAKQLKSKVPTSTSRDLESPKGKIK
jgi:hypothetical protein